jgi:hypothetical protein
MGGKDVENDVGVFFLQGSGGEIIFEFFAIF